jgi:hypothetical protein
LREKYVCLSGFFIGGQGPPFYFFFAVFYAFYRGDGRMKTARKTAEIQTHAGAVSKLAAVVPASRLEGRRVPEITSSGIPQLDALTGGLARGCLTEICGAASSGRTSVLLFALAQATQRGEVCALIDASDAFDPASAAAAGMEMSRLLWVRCRETRVVTGLRPVRAGQSPPATQSSAENGFGFSRWESQLAQMLKVTDLLLQSNGFGMIALDLGDIPARSARRIPLASWFRFRRAVEHTPTVLLVLEQQPIAGSCSSLLVNVSIKSQVAGKRLSAVRYQPSENPPTQSELPHSKLLDQFEIIAELMHSRSEKQLERKPVQSTASFKSRAAWAG